MTKLAVCVAVVIMSGWLSSPLLAQQAATRPGLPRFELSGMHIGDPVSEAFAKDRQPKREGNGETVMVETMSMSGETILAQYRFSANGSLQTVTVNFASDSYPSMVKAFSEKLGVLPSKTGSQKQRLASGVEVVNELAVWDIDCGKFVIKKYDSNHPNNNPALGVAWTVVDPEPKQGPGPVERLEIGGLHLGDPLTQEFVTSREIEVDDAASPVILEKVMVQGSWVKIEYNFENRKLESVLIEFSPHQYQAVLAMFTQKFGKPTVQRTLKGQNALGGEYEREVSRWDRGGETFFLRSCNPDMSKGSASLEKAKK